jgi:hypothetical protein
MPVAAIKSAAAAPSGPACRKMAHSATSGPAGVSVPPARLRPGRFWGRWQRAGAGVPGDVPGYLVVGDQVGPCPPWHGMLGGRQQERPGLGERVRVPASGHGPLPQDQVRVPAFADPQAGAHIHLRADTAAAHRGLGWALGGGHQADRHGAAAPCHGVRVALGVVGQFDILVDDGYQGGAGR